ncbi:MAG: SRPBCC domain-containing protein [Chloroflexota bacterium]
MKRFSTTLAIAAPAERIWQILTDASAYPTWNSTVDGVDGRIALGEKVTVRAKISHGRAFPVTVRELEPNKRMVWSSSMPLGLFKGQRTFTLDPLPDGTVEFAMTEVFTGLLAPLIGKSIPDLQPAFDAFAECLKACAETAG